MQPRPIDPRDLRSEDLRGAARFVEETVIEALDGLDELANGGFGLPVAQGRRMPRLSPESRAAVRGVDVLRAASNDVIAALYALALAREQDIELPAVAFRSVEPYLVAYFDDRRTKEGDDESGRDRTSAG